MSPNSPLADVSEQGLADQEHLIGSSSSHSAIRWTIVVLVLVATLGLTVSALLAEADIWAMATLSHLSADPGSGPIFRVTMLCVGVIALALARQVGRLLGRLRRRGIIDRPWAALYVVAFWTIGLGFLGVGVFPLGLAPLVELAHGTAAYAIPISVLILMFTARLAIPDLGPRFGRASLVVLAAALLLYLTALKSVISFAGMEAVAFGLGAAWFVTFVERLIRLDGG